MCLLPQTARSRVALARYHRIDSMATLLLITSPRRDGGKPDRRCQGQPASTPLTAIHFGESLAGADRSLAALTAQYYRRWQPSAVEERLLVDLLISADWQLRRLKAVRRWHPPEPA